MKEQDLQYVVDQEGNNTAVIISIETFEKLLDTLEELEEHYYSHHPEEREQN